MHRFILCVLLLSLVASLDYVTGSNVRFGGIYLLAVAIAAWNLPLRWLVCYVAATVSVWTTVNWLTDPREVKAWTEVWNSFSRLLSALLLSGAIYKIKVTLGQQQRLISELRRTSLELSRLKEMIPACRLCGKVHVEEGYPSRLSKLLAQTIDPDSIGDVCPDCLEERHQRVSDVQVAERLSSQAV